MGRKARIPSSTDIYHIGTRGVGQQNIFNDDSDRRLLLDIMSESLEKNDGFLYSWVLMSNHYHLLLNMDFFRVSSLMQMVNAQYARYFNRKYDRIGHLFQQRYWQDPIESEERLITCARYIHLNPVKANISKLEDYSWSSYQDYIDNWHSDSKESLTDTSIIKGIFGSKDSFIDFHRQTALEAFSEGGFKRMTMNDSDAAKLARRLVGDSEFDRIGSMQPHERDDALSKLKDAGMSVRQLQRLTGLGRYIISKA